MDEFTSLAPRPVAVAVAAGVAAYVKTKKLRRVVCATVHEDVVAPLAPRWLFATAVVTSCWSPKGKTGFEPTGDARYGVLALLKPGAAAAPPAVGIAAAGGRAAELFEAPDVRMQLRRCPYYHYETFKKHHYLSEKISPSAWCWELTWHGRPIAFHAAVASFGLPGTGAGSTGASREHRVSRPSGEIRWSCFCCVLQERRRKQSNAARTSSDGARTAENGKDARRSSCSPTSRASGWAGGCRR